MRNKATRTNEWEREHFGGSPLDPFESSKGYSTDGGAAFCFGGGTPDCLSVGAHFCLLKG